MASVIPGVVGGSLATLVVTAPMMLLGDGGPPPTALVENVVGGDPCDHDMPGMVLQLGYGIVHVAYGLVLGTGVLA